MGWEHADAAGPASAERSRIVRQPALILRGLLGATLVALAAVTLVAAPSASAAQASHDVADGAWSSARHYWSPQRMRSVRDLRTRREASPAELRSSGLRSIADSATPGLANPGAFSNVDLANTRPPRPPTAGSRDPRSGRYVAPPFTSGAVDAAEVRTYPYSANGKLFGVYRGFGGYSCSATVITSGSHNVILTAGHCLRDRDAGWARHVIFIPAYENGARPFGGWSASYMTVPRGWAQGNFHQDYGAVKLSSVGNPVGSVVGEEGLAWNQPREQLYQAIGYPYNFGQTKYMWNCLSAFGGVDPVDSSRGPLDIGIGCDMGDGASGGGWTIRDSYGNPFVNGVTSYGYRNLKDVLFAAYLNGKVVRTVNAADRH